MSKGSLVRLSEVAKIQSGIVSDNDVYGLIIDYFDLCEHLGIPSDDLGYKVFTQGEIEIFYEHDIEEV